MHAGLDHEWSAERIARLQQLLAEGHSTAEIGRRMGVSKNTITGKVSRLGLAGQPIVAPNDPRRDSPRTRVTPLRNPRVTLPPLPSLMTPD